MRIKKIANNIINIYNTNNPEELTNKLNIDIIEYPLYNRIKGLFIYDSYKKKAYNL